MNPPIINRPEREGRVPRTAWHMLTAVAWLAYLYLWLPLITLIAWVAGVRTAYGKLYQDQVVDSFLLLVLPVIALVCGAVLLGWAEYNRARFAGEERRSPMPSVGDAEVASALGADTATVDALRSSRIIAVAMDPQARPSIAASRTVLPAPAV